MNQHHIHLLQQIHHQQHHCLQIIIRVQVEVVEVVEVVVLVNKE